MPIKVKGIGVTPFGEHWGKTLKDLIKEAVDTALEDAKCSIEDIQAVYMGNMLSGELSQQSQLGALMAELYNFNGLCLRVEAACASGGMAVHQALQSIKAGAKKVLVIGAEKMTDHSPHTIAKALMQAASEEEREAGATFPALYALMAKAHMKAHGTTQEDLAEVSVHMHKQAMTQKGAQYKKNFSTEDILNSPIVAHPLHLLDCSPISDGAAALVLSDEEGEGAFIIDSAVASDTLGLAQREQLDGLKSTQLAAEKIFKDTKYKLEDLDHLEVHDCFTIAGLMAVEDLGLAPKGKAAQLFKEEQTFKINPSGGLKAGGHPVGATGVKQVAEVAKRIRTGETQLGLTHNVGGTGATCVLHLLSNQS